MDDMIQSEDAINMDVIIEWLKNKDIIKLFSQEENIRKELKELSSVISQPKIGYWIDDEFGSKCSYCGIYTHLDKFDRPMKFKYCSMCGAKMEVEE